MIDRVGKMEGNNKFLMFPNWGHLRLLRLSFLEKENIIFLFLSLKHKSRVFLFFLSGFLFFFPPHPLLLSFSHLTALTPVIDGVMQIFLSWWNGTITCAQIITSLRNAPASLHSQLLLCIWSYNHSPTMHLMGLLAADQNLLVNKPDGVWF